MGNDLEYRVEGGISMLCDICKKREAKIFYTEIKNGEKQEQHLCEECATEYTPSLIIKNVSGLGGILSGLLLGAAGTHQEKQKETICPVCGLGYEEFLKQGRFGCAQCYHTFAPFLEKLLKNLHGADCHCGKHLKKNDLSIESTQKENHTQESNLSEIERLTLQLQQAVEVEEFEEAARLRDIIRDLKQKQKVKRTGSSKEGKEDGKMV